MVIHFAKDVKSFEELDSKIGSRVRVAWKRERLPFPSIVDATRRTFDNFGIDFLPTTILIDPAGKLWGYANEEVLERILLEPRKKQP